ncbi:MAG: HIT family protein [Planctomycetota bacterium]
MAESVFAKIVAGSIPCHRLYEDEHVLAFLDVGPIARGHCLLIPKVGYVELDEMPPKVGAALGRVMPQLCAAVKSATGCDGVNVLQNNGSAAGQAVMHVHFHFIPRYTSLQDGKNSGSGGGNGLHFEWRPGPLGDDDAARLQDAIMASLAK